MYNWWCSTNSEDRPTVRLDGHCSKIGCATWVGVGFLFKFVEFVLKHHGSPFRWCGSIAMCPNGWHGIDLQVRHNSQNGHDQTSLKQACNNHCNRRLKRKEEEWSAALGYFHKAIKVEVEPKSFCGLYSSKNSLMLTWWVSRVLKLADWYQTQSPWSCFNSYKTWWWPSWWQMRRFGTTLCAILSYGCLVHVIGAAT